MQLANLQEFGEWFQVVGTLLAMLASVAASFWLRQRTTETDKLREVLEREILGEEPVSEARGAGGASDPRKPGEKSATSEGRSLHFLQKKYHELGLSQANISFWFSITFGTIGFVIILIAAAGALVNTVDWSKAVIPLISGTIIDAIAGIFYVQQNKSRQLMADFFSILRAEQNSAEALRLADTISDPKISSSLKAYLAMHLAGIDVGVDGFRSVVGLPVPSRMVNSSARAKTKATSESPTT